MGGGYSDMQLYICVNNGFEIYPKTHFSHDAEIIFKTRILWDAALNLTH